LEQNVFAIKFIQNPSLVMQLSALKQNGYAVQFTENPNCSIATN